MHHFFPATTRIAEASKPASRGIFGRFDIVVRLEEVFRFVDQLQIGMPALQPLAAAVLLTSARDLVEGGMTCAFAGRGDPAYSIAVNLREDPRDILLRIKLKKGHLLW